MTVAAGDRLRQGSSIPRTHKVSLRHANSIMEDIPFDDVCERGFVGSAVAVPTGSLSGNVL